MGTDIIVIGGGIHGITVAIAAAEAGGRVTLIDKNLELLNGTSGSTHNRAHMGYHYPRSVETAHECQKGLESYQKHYPEALIYPPGYYIIEKTSNTTTTEYESFCTKMGIPSRIQWPSEEFLLRDRISAPFLVHEPIFNTVLLRAQLEKKYQRKGVAVKNDAEVVESSPRTSDLFSLTVREGQRLSTYQADVVINATYSYANNVLGVFHLHEHMTRYRMQVTEVVVAQSALDIPPLTIMDGPFMSIMPYGGHDTQFLVYDVEHSVADEKESYLHDDSRVYPSSWETMVQKGESYFPFMKELTYVESLWGSRPIPVDSATQSRKTRLVRYDSSPGFYSLLEGKFVSAPLVARDLVAMIKEDGFLS